MAFVGDGIRWDDMMTRKVYVVEETSYNLPQQKNWQQQKQMGIANQKPRCIVLVNTSVSINCLYSVFSKPNFINMFLPFGSHPFSLSRPVVQFRLIRWWWKTCEAGIEWSLYVINRKGRMATICAHLVNCSSFFFSPMDCLIFLSWCRYAFSGHKNQPHNRPREGNTWMKILFFRSLQIPSIYLNWQKTCQLYSGLVNSPLL